MNISNKFMKQLKNGELTNKKQLSQKATEVPIGILSKVLINIK